MKRNQRNWLPRPLDSALSIVCVPEAIYLGAGSLRMTLLWYFTLGFSVFALRFHSGWYLDAAGKPLPMSRLDEVEIRHLDPSWGLLTVLTFLTFRFVDIILFVGVWVSLPIFLLFQILEIS